jgi:putative tryptophan/tyrosine transport system substrate-binding protein
MTDRRAFVGTVAALVGAMPRTAAAQAAKVARVGFLGNGDPTSGEPQLKAFHQGMRELGWIEGRTFTIVYRWAGGDSARLQALATELVQAKVDVIVLSGAPAVAAVQKVTRTVPVVFVLLIDPVEMGFVQALARPSGNMTGLASQFDELVTKQLQLLKEAVPNLTRVALLRHVTALQSTWAAAETAARSLGLISLTLSVATEADFAGAFETARRERIGAVHVLPSPYLGARRARLIALAAQYRLPAFYELRLYVEDGGLMSYGPSATDLYGRSASYVDRILKGADPGHLPIERPSKFEFVINQRAATALGLAIPQSLLSRADEVLR